MKYTRPLRYTLAVLRIDVITLFPEVIEAGTRYSIVGRAQERGLVSIRAIQLRDFATDKHRTVDDEPYGGGAGLVMKPEPIFRAVESCRDDSTHRSDYPAGATRQTLYASGGAGAGAAIAPHINMRAL
jgi:tRNA (guanine-N1)-methyltransferase